MSLFGICRYTWVDNDTILANVIPEGTSAPPTRPPAPTGPRIQDNALGTKVLLSRLRVLGPA